MPTTNKQTIKKKTISSKRVQMVSVEVLQNGISVARASQRLGRTEKLKITSKPNGPLSIPMYPLPDEVTIVRSSKGKSYLHLDNAWDGFIVLNGNVKEVVRTDRSLKEFELANGDYASLLLGDLRVLVKVASERKTPIVPPLSQKYRAPLFSLVFRDKQELGGIAASFAIAAIVFALFSFGLSSLKVARPKALEDLSAIYTMPFIAPGHFDHSPEILQNNLDRSDYVASIVNYYRGYSSMTNGGPATSKHGLFPSTIESYAASFREADAKIALFSEKQRKIEEASLKRPMVGILAIPSVRGESVDGSLLRIIDKVDLQHEAAKVTLDLRKSISGSFREDKEYNIHDYKGKSSSLSGLDKIKMISLMEMTDEQEMYVKAATLGRIAASKRERTRRVNEKFGEIAPYGGPIEIPSGVEFASFLSGIDYILADEKIDRLQATEFGTQKTIEIVKEPLIGEIEPKLVEKTIQKHRFELQLCFELALRRNQLTRGTMEWKWRIDSRGQISDISLVSSTIADNRMSECIRDKMGKWRFPRPRRGSIEVSYPFEFNPSRG